ncbi:MAG: DUF805 domain-containing protein [Anaerolineales bacterium]
MDLKDLLFSFEGRINRQPFWLFALPIGLIGMLLAAFIYFVSFRIGLILTAIFGLLIIYPSLAVAVKRWHDLDKSGWWMCIALVPVVGQIWALVETGFLPGTVGPNQYGPDPLQLSRAGEAVQAQQPSLTAVAGPLAGRMLTLAAGDLLVGSDARCDVSLPGAGVLDRHARIRYAKGAWFIQEIMGSSAGIMVNGQPIKACRLNNGDQITIGPNTVVFNM